MPGASKRIQSSRKCSARSRGQARPRTQAKRLKPQRVLKTPFVSLSGTPYTHCEETHRQLADLVVLQVRPFSNAVQVPDHVGQFLYSTAAAISTKVYDVLTGPDFLIVMVAIESSSKEKFDAFLKTNKVRIPNTDCFLRFRRSDMEELLKPYEGMDMDSDTSSGDDFEPFTELSNSDDEPEMQIPEATPQSRPGSSRRFRRPPWEEPLRPVDPVPTAPTPSQESHLTPSRAPVTQLAAEAEPGSMTVAEPEIPAQSSKRSKPRSKFSPIDFSTLTVPVPEPTKYLTVLFRPTQAGVTLKNCNPAKLNRELRHLGLWVAVRDIRDGGIAVDFDEGTKPDPILSTTSLLGLPVAASLPMVASACAGVVSGVHWELTMEEILEEASTTPPVKITAAKRLARPGERSWVVKLSFEGTVLPTHISLYGRRHAIKTYRHSPLLCFKCSRYGHIARVCKSERRCQTCTQDHDSKECPNLENPLCCNCKGAHPANDTKCPTRSFELKVNEVKAEHNISFKTARKAVSKAARSYSAVVKGSSPATAGPNHNMNSSIPTNVVHPKPRPEPACAATLAALFKGLLTILTAAATSGDLAAALGSISTLFKSLDPASDPSTYSLPG